MLCFLRSYFPYCAFWKHLQGYSLPLLSRRLGKVSSSLKAENWFFFSFLQFSVSLTHFSSSFVPPRSPPPPPPPPFLFLTK
jgi:hypothetical protein